MVQKAKSPYGWGQGTEDSKHNPFGATNIQTGYASRCPSFPRIVRENPLPCLSALLRSPRRRRANGILSCLPLSSPQNKAIEASPSQHDTILCWEPDGASKAAAAFTQSPRPAIRDRPRRPPAIARPRVASSGVASRPAAAWARVSQKVFSPV
jgi:hypothetical protein